MTKRTPTIAARPTWELSTIPGHLVVGALTDDNIPVALRLDDDDIVALYATLQSALGSLLD